MNKASLTQYRNVKQYLITCILLQVAAQIASFVSAGIVISKGIEHPESSNLNLADVISYMFQIVFFVFLVLLLIQVVEYYNKKK